MNRLRISDAQITFVGDNSEAVGIIDRHLVSGFNICKLVVRTVDNQFTGIGKVTFKLVAVGINSEGGITSTWSKDAPGSVYLTVSAAAQSFSFNDQIAAVVDTE